MSRTRKETKGPGYDFWSRRCFGSACDGYGKSAKQKTKQRERQRDREMEFRAMQDPEDFECRFPGE